MDNLSPWNSPSIGLLKQDQRTPFVGLNSPLMAGPPVTQPATQSSPSYSATPATGPGTQSSTSKVAHLRQLPLDASEVELAEMARPFGNVEKVLILKGKGQGFIQMTTHGSALQLIQFYSATPAILRGKHILFQFSTRDEITSLSEPSTPNSIVLVTVQSMLYPVTIEVLHGVFSRFGNVKRIILFNKNAGFQALIEMSRVEEAVQAKQGLDGQNIYRDCCLLKVQFSSVRAPLSVRYNNNKSRDFDNLLLPANPLLSTLLIAFFPYVDGWMSPNTPTTTTSVVIVSNLNPKFATVDVLFTLFGFYGDVVRVKILHNKPNRALIQFATSAQWFEEIFSHISRSAVEMLNGCPLHGETLSISYSKYTSLSQPRSGEDDPLTKDFTNSPLHRYRNPNSKNLMHVCPPSETLHISNISPTLTKDLLCKLFSHYGVVRNFRYLSADQKMAYIQMSSLDESVSCLIHLHNHCATPDQVNLRVSFSRAQI